MSRFTSEVTQVGFDVNTGKRYCVGYFICDTFADLPSKTEYTNDNIILMIGTRATVIDPASEYRMKEDGTWCIDKVKNNTYSKDEIDAIINTINDKDDDQDIAITNLQTQNTNQQQEIDYSINTGAKNILNITQTSRVHNGVTFTVNSDESVSISGGTTGSNSFMRLTGIQTSTAYSEQIPLPKGRYKISCPGALSTDNFRFAVGYRNTSTDSRSTITAQQSNGFEAEFEITTDTGRFDATILSVSTDPDYSATVYPMIRCAEITDDTFEPYAPTNRELYEMILQLQQTTGLRTMSLSTSRGILQNKEEITLDEEEIPQDEER